MSHEGNTILLIACSVLRNELELLARDSRIKQPIKFLDSMLHIYPEKLYTRLSQAILDAQSEYSNIILIYGDCCPLMSEIQKKDKVKRINGVNCCELLLGHTKFQQHLREGVFFLIYEWACRWHEIFSTYLGLSSTNAMSFMKDMHSKFLYLDTGVAPIPYKQLDEISRYCALPYEIEQVSLDQLLLSIEEACHSPKEGLES